MVSADAAPPYDVAISFVASDEPLALQLRDLLSPPLSTFVYSKRQEELAGKDGVEAFRDVFRNRARLVVILYRRPWGETPWTRVEKTAIEELCLEDGWEHLMLVRLDRDGPVPKWIPKPHIHLDLTTFTLADLVGAVKGRLIELGVEIVQPTPAARAAAQARMLQFDAETAKLLDRSAEPFQRAAQQLCAAITTAGAEIATQTGWKVESGDGAFGGFVINANGQTIQLSAREIYINTARDAYLELEEYDQHIPVRQVRYSYYALETLRSVHSRRMTLKRLAETGWCWDLDGRVLPISAAADAIVHILLDRIEARNRRE